jgi:putative ABC transport system permease protein
VRLRPRDGVLVVALVALPAAIIMAVLIVSASSKPTVEEYVRAELGAAQAWIEVVAPEGTQVWVAEDGTLTTDDFDGEEQDISGRDPRDLLPAGAEVLRVEEGPGIASAGERAARVQLVQGEVWNRAFEGRYTVTAGEPPSAADEVMVSPTLASRLDVGLGDVVTLGDALPVTVVGLLAPERGWDEGEVYAAEGLALPWDNTGVRWYVASPLVDSQMVSALEADGFVAFSRGAGGAPPSTSGAGADGIAGVGFGLVEVVLLAGAAFAVSMRRRQHALALLAATGAERRALVGIGVATGVWLGLLGGVSGVIFGVGAGWAWLQFLVRWGGPEGLNSVWGFHLLWWHAAVAIGFGVLSGALASLVPALQASRVDVIAALRGSQRPRRVRAWSAIVGVLLVGAGVAGWIVAGRMTNAALDLPFEEAQSASGPASLVAVLATVAVFTGGAFALPHLLGLVARGSGSLGVAPRIAARDAARNAGRTVPVVVAVAATVVLAASTYLDAERTAAIDATNYAVDASRGEAYVDLMRWSGDLPEVVDADEVIAALRPVLPQASMLPITTWLDPSSIATDETSYVLAVPDSKICPAVLADANGFAPQVSAREMAQNPNCSTDMGTESWQAGVGGAELLEVLLGRPASPEALATLENGGAVVLLPQLEEGGLITVASQRAGERTGSFTLPAVVEEPENPWRRVDAVISPETAAKHSIPVAETGIFLAAPTPFTQGDSDAAYAALVREDVYMYRQEVPGGYDRMIQMASLGVVLLVALVATAIALGLARAEARRDDFTLASLGASPGLTKAVAGWQGAITVFLALMLGITCALGQQWVTAHKTFLVSFSPPWLILGAVLVLVPALVGGIGAIFTKKPRAIHYRLAA